MRRQSRKIDFPDQTLDSVGNGERWGRTNARLSRDRERTEIGFVERHGYLFSFAILGPYKNPFTLWGKAPEQGLWKRCNNVFVRKRNTTNGV